MTVSFSADFKETFGRANSKPCDHFLCGTGTVAGYGDATSIFDLTSFSLIEGTSCGTLTAVRTITLSSDGSTLRLDEEGTVCFPGESPTAPGAQHSFGNPGEIDTTFTVKKGTGVFQGREGQRHGQRDGRRRRQRTFIAERHAHLPVIPSLHRG